MPRRMSRARRDATALEAEPLAAARAGGDLDDGSSLEGRHVEIAAQGGFEDAHRHLADEVVPLAPEQRMRLDPNRDVGVSGRAASEPVIPLPRNANPLAVVDTRGDARLDLLGRADAAATPGDPPRDRDLDGRAVDRIAEGKGHLELKVLASGRTRPRMASAA